MQMDPSGWVTVIERDYLADFVREGGAAVKFVVSANETGRGQIRDRLREAADRDSFQFAFVDASVTKIHLIDRLFHDVARQIDWDVLIDALLRRLLSESGISVPEAERGLALADLAALNGSPEIVFRTQVNRLIANALFRDYAMSQEFRFAMIFLCQSRLEPEADPALGDAIKAWLRGELRLVSGVKRALIFQKIARHNARHMLFSLAHWLKVAGRSGLVLVLDIARYADSRRPAEREGGLYYSTAAALDAYEVLRQLIDATDELEYGFVCVLTGPEFLSDDRRGVRSYHALNLRIADEVRDRYRPNPLSALTHLSTDSLAVDAGIECSR